MEDNAIILMDGIIQSKDPNQTGRAEECSRRPSSGILLHTDSATDRDRVTYIRT